MGCQVATIHNAIAEMALRLEHAPLKRSYADVSRAVRWNRVGGVAAADVVPGLTELLRGTGFQGREVTGGAKQNALADLRRVVISANCSYPIVALGAEFLAGPHKTYTAANMPPSVDHSVIVCGIDEEKNQVEIVDPWEGMIKKVTPELIPTLLSLPDFFKYWRDTSTPYSSVWIEGKQMKPLEAFEEKKQ